MPSRPSARERGFAFRHEVRCRRRHRRRMRASATPEAGARSLHDHFVEDARCGRRERQRARRPAMPEVEHREAASAARSACARRRASDGAFASSPVSAIPSPLRDRCRFDGSSRGPVSRSVKSVVASGVAKGGCASARRRGRALSPRASASMATDDSGEAGHGKSASAARSAGDADAAAALRPARGMRTCTSATPKASARSSHVHFFGGARHGRRGRRRARRPAKPEHRSAEHRRREG